MQNPAGFSAGSAFGLQAQTKQVGPWWIGGVRSSALFPWLSLGNGHLGLPLVAAAELLEDLHHHHIHMYQTGTHIHLCLFALSLDPLMESRRLAGVPIQWDGLLFLPCSANSSVPSELPKSSTGGTPASKRRSHFLDRSRALQAAHRNLDASCWCSPRPSANEASCG